MDPPPWIEQLVDTHICESAVRELAIPLVLNLRDLPAGFIIEDVDLAVDGLFFTDALDDIASSQIQADGIAT